ncbi:glycosyltransferase family 4 protein [Oleisolibacter albus]|uniref:glycosyltransferase family 4 protein n=1 Tax=Oleisolibacter albus TaxID=2171757 RepID=UPI00138FBF29|nr:glycosyltransferase family 4 protein [Oleisolibacter albus]
MRIIMVSDFAHVTGGAARVAITAAAALARSGVEVDYVTALGPLDPALDQAPVRVHRLQAEHVWDRRNPVTAVAAAIWDGNTQRQFGRLLAGCDPARTIVHFQQWTKAMTPSVIAEASRRGFAHAVTLHDYFIACPNGNYYSFPKARPCQARPMSPGCIFSRCDSRSSLHKAVRLARHLALQQALARSGHLPDFIHVSAAAQAVIGRFLPPAAVQHVVPNPVQVVDHGPAPVDDNTRFLFVGRLTPEKGCLQVAEAARLAGVPVTFVGEGPCDPQIRRLNPAAEIISWMPPESVLAMMRRSRALVFASTWQETAGLVCIEALANGLPVIVTAGSAATGLVESGETGIVIPPADVPALVTAMRALAGPHQAARLGAAAHWRYWRNPLDEERHVRELTGVYRDMLARRHSPVPVPFSVMATPEAV